MFKNNKLSQNKNFKLAFTLAEVLMVTAIIGVVAVLAVPNISRSTDIDKNIILIKSVYGTIESGFNAFFNEYGTIYELREGGRTYDSIRTLLNDHLGDFIKIGRICSNNALTGCFASGTVKNVDNSTYKANLVTYMKDNDGIGFELQNGATFAILLKSSEVCFDTNGLNKPNTAGIDIFCLGYSTNGSFSTGIMYTTAYDGTFQHKPQSYLEWILAFSNMDYLTCANSLNWKTKHSCN